MTISKELFPAVFVLESCNRGFTPNHRRGGTLGGKTGSVTAVRHSGVGSDSEGRQESFYAVKRDDMGPAGLACCEGGVMSVWSVET